jgi:hypothetical protein
VAPILAFIVPNRLAPLAHFLRVIVEPTLHGLEHLLMLPACDASLLASRFLAGRSDTLALPLQNDAAS